MGFSLVLENGGYLQVAGLRCHCSGFSVAECGLQGAWFSAAVARGLPAAAPGSRAQARWLRRMGLAACHVDLPSSGMEAFSCMGRRILSHWGTREAWDQWLLSRTYEVFRCLSGSCGCAKPLLRAWGLPHPALPTLISTRVTLFPPDSFIYWQHFIQNTIHVKITHPLSLETTEAGLFIIFFHLKNILIQLPLSTSINNWVEGTVYLSWVSIHLHGGKTVLIFIIL